MHTSQIAVRFSELDPYGHLNHAVYATYFETARIEALDENQLGLAEVAEQGYQFVVVELRLRFRQPALAGDRLTVETAVTEIGRATTRWTQRLLRADELLATAEIRSAVTDTSGHAVRPPRWLVERLEPLRSSG